VVAPARLACDPLMETVPRPSISLADSSSFRWGVGWAVGRRRSREPSDTPSNRHTWQSAAFIPEAKEQACRFVIGVATVPIPVASRLRMPTRTLLWQTHLLRPPSWSRS